MSCFPLTRRCRGTPDRIGHGLHLFDTELVLQEGKLTPEEAEAYVTALSEYVAQRRVLIEVCLTSNLQTCPGVTLATHPLALFLEKR